MAPFTRTAISLFLAVLCTISTCMHASSGDVLCIESDGRTAIESAASRAACCDSPVPVDHQDHGQSVRCSHRCYDVPLVPQAVASHAPTSLDLHHFLCTLPSDLPRICVASLTNRNRITRIDDRVPRLSLPQQSVCTFVILI
jgi:hypothetical protein